MASGHAPGKRTLTENLFQDREAAAVDPVQRKESGQVSGAEVHEAAQRGVAGGGSRLPHFDIIQKSFGSHDVSNVQAHTGEAAQRANQEIGAQAYASGNHVAFAGTPDLHTAAHEAAHVVQQRAGVHLKGGIGEAGDVYEQHADAVADRVVASESAADLLTAGPIASVPAGGWGNGVQRKIAAPTPTTKTEGTSAADASGGAKKIAKLHLYVDIEAQNLGIDELQNGSVGHTWIAIEYADPAAVPESVHAAHKDLLRAGGKYSDPMGFWPDIQNGVGYSTNPFNSYVQGWMSHPDRAHEGAEKAMQTWDLTQAEVDAVIAYAESKRGAMYSVYFFNCTTFGVQAVSAAGKSAPSASSFRIMFPNAIYDGIKERQEKGVGNTMTKDFDGGNEQIVHGPDTKKDKRPDSALGKVPEPGKAPESAADKANLHIITDPKAIVRSDPPALAPTGQTISTGAKVRVVETAVKGKNSYVKVEEVLPEGTFGPPKMFGWTGKTNLSGFEAGGHERDEDPTLRPDDAILLDGLKDLERRMAIIYNSKAKYLDEQAKALGVSTAAAAAVLKVESGGGGFANDGRMIIRFENHVFYDKWGKGNKVIFDKHFQYDHSHRWQGHKFRKSDTGEFVTAHQSQSQEWEILEFARSLSNDSALESISMGAAQIMGFNYEKEGYASVQAMFDQMSGAINPQLVGMFTFIKNTPLCINGLKEGDYVKFAKGYNGSGKAEEYGAALKAAADAWTKVTKDKDHGG